MKALIKNLMDFFSCTDNTAFQYGYLTGAAVSILVVILIFLLIMLMHSSNKCKGIALASAGGKLYIAASAIADLVKASEKDFPFLQITKCLLVEKKHVLSLELKVNFPPETASEPLPVMAEALQGKIYENLKKTFGIENITEINIEVSRSKKA